MKTYHGHEFSDPGPGTVLVKTDEEDYELSSELGHDSQESPNHSPDGFQAGYGGSGPSQLAWALVADAVDVESANEWYQRFKDEVVAGMDDDIDEFMLDAEFVRSKIAGYETQ